MKRHRVPLIVKSFLNSVSEATTEFQTKRAVISVRVRVSTHKELFLHLSNVLLLRFLDIEFVTLEAQRLHLMYLVSIASIQRECVAHNQYYSISPLDSCALPSDYFLKDYHSIELVTKLCLRLRFSYL